MILAQESDHLESLLQTIGELTLDQATTLKEMMKERFKVDIPDPGAVFVQQPVAQEPEEEKTEFSLIITSTNDRVGLMKALRALTNLGIRECKDIVDNIPRMVMEQVSKNDIDRGIEALKGVAEVKVE